MKSKNELMQDFIIELRRGTTVLVVLNQLLDAEYGYSLVQKLDVVGYPIEANTLYPLLRRLEKQGLLESEWEMGEPRPRKFYQTSAFGKEVLEAYLEQWEASVSTIDKMIGGKES